MGRSPPNPQHGTSRGESEISSRHPFQPGGDTLGITGSGCHGPTLPTHHHIGRCGPQSPHVASFPKCRPPSNPPNSERQVARLGGAAAPASKPHPDTLAPNHTVSCPTALSTTHDSPKSERSASETSTHPSAGTIITNLLSVTAAPSRSCDPNEPLHRGWRHRPRPRTSRPWHGAPSTDRGARADRGPPRLPSATSPPPPSATIHMPSTS
jgi:hypothetical protein